MPEYKLTYFESFYADVEIEAESREQAEELFWRRWETDSDFVDEILDEKRVVTDSGLSFD